MFWCFVTKLQVTFTYLFLMFSKLRSKIFNLYVIIQLCVEQKCWCNSMLVWLHTHTDMAMWLNIVSYKVINYSKNLPTTCLFELNTL